jgi:hypothetical protein
MKGYKDELINLGPEQQAIAEKISIESDGIYNLVESYTKLLGVMEQVKNEKATALESLNAQITAAQTPDTGKGTGGKGEKSKLMSAEDHALIMLKAKIDKEKDEHALKNKETEGTKILTEEIISEAAARETNIAALERELARRTELNNIKKQRADGQITGRMAAERTGEVKANEKRQERLDIAKIDDEAFKKRGASLKAMQDEDKKAADAEKKYADETKKLEEGIWSFVERGRKDTLAGAIAKIHKETEDAIAKVEEHYQKHVAGNQSLSEKEVQDATDKKNADIDKLNASGKDQIKTTTEQKYKAGLSDFEQELSRMAQIKGGLFMHDYVEVFEVWKAGMVAAAGDTEAARLELELCNEVWARFAIKQHIGESAVEGFSHGMRKWGAEVSNSFKNMEDAALALGNTLETSLSGAFEKAFEKGKTGGEKWKEIGEGMKTSALKILTDLAAKQTLAALTGDKLTASTQANSKAAAQQAVLTQLKTAATKDDMQAALQNAVATGMLTQAMAVQLGLQPAETALTLADAEANELDAQAKAKAAGAEAIKSATSQMGWIGTAAVGIPTALAILACIQKFAKGGLVDEPTLALIGETGEREFVAPEKDFLTWAREYTTKFGTDFAADYQEAMDNIEPVQWADNPDLGRPHIDYEFRERMIATVEGIRAERAEREAKEAEREQRWIAWEAREIAREAREVAYAAAMSAPPVQTYNSYTYNTNTYTMHTKKEMADFVSGLMDYQARRGRA